MLKKLMKYDLQYIFKFLIIFYSLAIFFGLLTRIFFSFENSFVLDILGQITTGATISMICSTLINNLMRMWVRFKHNFYGDESYLTHTLPVEKHTHYFSKILTSVITLFTSFAVIGAVLLIAYYSKENLLFVKNFLLPVAEIYDSSVLSILLVLLFILFLEFLNILQCGFTGIIIGHKMNNAKTGLSVLFGFIAFGVTQSFVLIIMFVVALFNENFMNLFVTNDIINIDTLKSVICIAIAVYTVVSVLLCFVNIKLFKNGVNVD